MLPFLDDHSGAITAIATVVLVVVTIVYVVYTRQLVRESQRDRDAAFQPQLTWSVGRDANTNKYIAKVVNNSKASAYYCVLVSTGGNSTWLRSEPFDIGPSESADTIEMTNQADLPQGGFDSATGLGFCQNQFGYTFCLQLGKTEVTSWPPAAKRRRRGSRVPAGVTWYERFLSTYQWL